MSARNTITINAIDASDLCVMSATYEFQESRFGSLRGAVPLIYGAYEILVKSAARVEFHQLRARAHVQLRHSWIRARPAREISAFNLSVVFESNRLSISVIG